MDTEIQAKPELKVIKEDEIHHILEAGEVGAILELVVTDKEGKITEKRVLKSESFVRQFLDLLWVHMYGIMTPTVYQIRDILNTQRNISTHGLSFGTNAGATVVTQGIIIGTGVGAVTINDYVIGTIIPHATMNYSAVTFGAPASDTTTSQFTITRNFANVSGGAVVVQEIALYVNARYQPGAGAAGTTYNFMAIRDRIVGGLSVPNGQTLTINYRIQAVI